MENKILGFQGSYRWLSNFWPCKVSWADITFDSVEHAYVAAKTIDPDLRKEISLIKKPGDVKRFGRKIKVREDWDSVKLVVMEYLIKQKFETPHLRELLLATEDSYIEETNTWGDKFWGVCKGEGENNLGKIIMKVRSEIKNANV